MNEDDPTKNLPDEDAPTAEPIGILPHGSDTRPMLDRILAEVVSTREFLSTRIDAMETRLERVEDKLDVLNDHILTAQADVVALRRRVEKLEGDRAQ